MEIFYVYVYLDPRKPGLFEYEKYEFDYEPFYIGKGKENRINDKKNDHCEYKINKIRGLGFEPIKRRIIENIKETKAFEIEKELIKLIGKEILNEGPLTNLVDGGEGISGYKHAEETKEKLRKEYSIIKNEFERRDCELSTKEKDYKNNRQKLEYIHKECGNKHSISWNNFQREHGCPYCGTEECAKKQRKEYPEIKNTFERRNCKLLTKEEEYKNNYQKLEYIHNRCGRKHSIRWSSFKQGKGCPYCGKEERARKLRKNFPEIKNEFENRGCELLTKEEEYKNAHQKLEYKCPNGHEHSISWNNFQQQKNNYCPKCNKEKRIKLRE